MRKFHAIGAAFLLLAVGGVTAGCGGGGGAAGGGTRNGGGTSTPVPAGMGRMQVSLNWGGGARQTPTGASSVRVVVADQANNVLRSRIFVRPAGGGGVATETFDLPEGILKVRAEAYQNFDASGTPQADFQTNATVVGGKSETLTLTFGSTVASVAIKPDNIPFTGAPVQVNAVAFDAQGNVVLSSEWEWSSTDQNVIRMEASGANATLTAVGPGQTTITVREVSSGKTFGRVFNVAPLQ